MNEEKIVTEKETSDTEQLVRELDEEKMHSEEYLNRLKYMQADFDNFRKRVERQMEDIKKYSNERLVLELLDVVDELGLAVKSGRDSVSSEVLVQGVEMTLKKLRKILHNEGVVPIECIGKTFDPSKHNAISKIERDDIEEGIIVEEIRKGYIMREKVIRPSIVKVAVKLCVKSENLDGGLDE